MDKVKAAAWEADLTGKEIAGCTIGSLIDHGKSAAVFKATRNGEVVALKIFDDEIIERYGDKTQLARIDRELTLIGKEHPNMVKIVDGGVDATTGNHFITMEYLDGLSLERCLLSVPDDNVPLLIAQLASCCEYLETLSLAHRDIKPSNIVIMDNYTRLVLLDFGVLKPVGEIGVTDANGIQSFVGTFQYSSPEFLLRSEEDNVDGWRALSLYQLGGVLHDLIMRRPLFEEYANPYARLVNAVQNNTPNVSSTTVPTYLVEACRAALIKSPTTRLELVTWNSFLPPKKVTAGVAARERVTGRSLLTQALVVPEAASASGNDDLLEATINLIKVEARRIRTENTAALPPLSVTRVPRDSAIVDIGFRSAKQQGLPVGLTLQVGVDVVDVSSQAVALSVSAFTGARAAKPQDCEGVVVYRGVFNPVGIANALENSIYMAVDRAQLDTGADPNVALDLGELKVV
jgi:eukaryotic-like serine/threonine-protein kinase